MAALKFALPSDLFLLLLHYAGVDFGFLFGPGDSAVAVARALQIIEPAAQAPRPLVDGPVSALAGLPPAHAEVFCALSIVWAVGCLAVLSLWYWKRLQLSPRLEEGTGVECERVARALARVRSAMGMKRRVRLVISREAIEPGIWRVWRPVLALPADLSDQLSDGELDAMLMHELAHISRWDNLVSNFSMMICCALWFHPLVWVIDRRLLSERECSCDERVLELGVSSRVYAASLLKVLRFCVGWRVAGVSAATGSNLPQRVELILAFRAGGKASAASRCLIGSLAVAVLAFTVATGLLVQSDVVAQTLKTPRAVKQEPADVAGYREPGQAPRISGATPAHTGSPALSSSEERELMKEAEKAPFTPARFKNLDSAPVVITDAKVKVAAQERESPSNGDARGAYELLMMPRLTLVNNTNRRVALVHLRSEIPPSAFAVTTNRVSLGPYESVVLQVAKDHWSELLPAGSARSLVLSVARVVFEDGSVWASPESEDAEPVLAPSTPSPVTSALAPVARPDTPEPALAPAPAPVAAPERDTPAPARTGEYIPARFINPPGAPLTIYSALTPASVPSRSGDVAEQTALPVVTLINSSGRRIVAIKLRFKANSDAHAVSAFSVSLDPGASYTYRSDASITGSAASMKVQVIGVRFEDGSLWGSMTSRINTRDIWIEIPLTIRRSEDERDIR
jgi:beta-lactamase regulating signal transducer with metallopeptidase domain